MIYRLLVLLPLVESRESTSMEMIRRHTTGYNFMGDAKTGATFRWGDTFAENPVRAPWPELADISISNYCTNDCEYCYRSSNRDGDFISLTDYQIILKQLTSEQYGSVFQVALGGGEPLLHPDIVEILRTTKEDYNIVPNYTTSGFFFTQEILEATKKFCGAIAVSYDPYRQRMTTETLKTTGKILLAEGIKANIHFVVSDKTLDEAIRIMEGVRDKDFGDFNSIVFLTYKPFGKGSAKDCLKPDERLTRFLKLVEEPRTIVKFGFDACFVPFLFKKTKVDFDFLDSCECGFFSVYIDEHLTVSPCSFCNDKAYAFSLKNYEFAEIWEQKFEEYRKKVFHNCDDICDAVGQCRGQCEFFKELSICSSL